MGRLGKLLIVGTLALPMGLVAVAPAGAAAPVTCSNPKSVSNLKKSTATSTLTACTNKPATGGSGTMVVNFKNLNKITAKVTWKGTGTTTITLSEKAVTPNKCPTKQVEIKSTGKTTGGTGKALTLIKKGSPFSETVCANTTTGKTTILKGTKVTI